MKIIIVQCRNRKDPIGAKAIRFFSKTDYSHYAVLYDSPTGNRMAIDSTMKGVRPQHLSFFASHYRITKSFEIDIKSSALEFQGWVEKFYGKPYAVGQLFGILLQVLWFTDGMQKVTCNEFVLRLIERFFDVTIEGIDTKGLAQTEEIVRKFL